EPIRAALWHAFERWDGKGFPHRVKADAIAQSMRVVQLAQDMDVMYRAGGVDYAIAVARQRSGGAYDPDWVTYFCSCAADVLPAVHDGSAWDGVLTAEPAPQRVLDGERFDDALYAIADFADVKSPFTAGHSRGVAELATAAARGCRLPDA